MSEALQYSGTLTVTTCWCGIPHAVPQELYNKQNQEHRDGRVQTSIYCPLGHGWVRSGEGESAVLERQLCQERQRHDQTRAELREVGNRLNSEKAAKARIKNRIGKGICIHCNRSFENLRRHMETKHCDDSAKNAQCQRRTVRRMK